MTAVEEEFGAVEEGYNSGMMNSRITVTAIVVYTLSKSVFGFQTRILYKCRKNFLSTHFFKDGEKRKSRLLTIIII